MPISSGRIVKARKVKRGTLHQKNHRWESFTTKISKLNSLDPIRRVRRHDIDAEDLSTSTSYLKAGLEKWQDLNMSGNFLDFCNEVLPLCDSLPQILHFENKIMELMVTYIEKRERESLEPLLELMTNFAHDLGTRFEKHYAKALEMVTSIAGTPQDVEVIEWSFTCLAFMFKYLSKLLVSDLRPTYDLMAPLLGKHRQQTHIARFAAEAMSFLIKKAGAPANREKALPLIIHHAKTDLQSITDTRQFGLYYHGLMTMFAEAMKGNGLTVHTSGPYVFEALIQSLDDHDMQSKDRSPWIDVICGVLTSIIHHTSSDTFNTILEKVLERANAAVSTFTESKTEIEFRRLLLSARTIGIAAGVRKGVRVRDWPTLLKTLHEILEAVSKNPVAVAEYDQGLWNSLILSVSITIEYSPMDALIPFISKFMDALTKEPLAKWFLTFCWYVSETEPERFRSVALKPFQRFVVAHWSEDNGDTLCVLLPKMVSSGVLFSNHGKDGFALPQSWQDQIVSKFERLEVQPFPEQAAVYDRSPKTWHDRCLPKYNALLEVLECTKVHPSTNARIAEILLRKLKLALRPSSSLAAEEANFIVGRGFTAFSRMVRGVGEAEKALEPLLRAAAPRYARLPNFLEALLAYEKSLKQSPSPAVDPIKNGVASNLDIESDEDLLVNSLVANLSTESSDLRLLSLRLLEHIHITETGLASDALSIMIMVEQTPLDLATARSASMHIRKLATLHPLQPEGSWLKQAIPSFCFGMFNVKFAQIWEDASTSLKQIAESKKGEEAVAKLAFSWLETPSLAWNGSSRNVEHPNNNGMTDFECSNLMKLDQCAKDAETEVLKVRDTMLEKFDVAQQLVAAQPSSARAQALRVLTAAPGIAEKRSRQLVPMFLSWATKQADDIEQDGDDSGSILSDWTRKDQKAQLDLFGLFTNPRSLYKTDEVYEALLRLLANGDIEIQKSALKAIFTWKDKSIRPYEENLFNLLDEARFKDEITVLLQGQTLVQAEHRTELMPVLLRVLYGRAISRKGAASGRQGMEARRLTVLRNLGIQDVEDFLEIALGDLKNVDLLHDGQLNESLMQSEILSARKQVGFTNMIEVVLKELGTKVAPFTQRILDAVLYCIIHSSRLLKDLEDLNDSDDDVTNQPTQTSLLKVVRQTGLKCLILLFTNSESFDWTERIEIVVREIVEPRLDNLPIETAQGISGILRLFSTFASSRRTVLFLGGQILPKVAECLAPAKSKDEVKLFALGIIRNVIKIAQNERSTQNSDAGPSADSPMVPILQNGPTIQNTDPKIIQNDLLIQNVDHFLIQIGGLLHQQDLSKDLLEGCVETVSELAPFVASSTQARNLVDVSIFLLDQPSRRVNPKTKSGLLKVLERFVALYELQNDFELKDRLYATITSLFGFFKDKTSREVLSRVLMVFARKDPVIGEVAKICVDLNSFMDGRLDEPDYARRLTAFIDVVDTKRGIPFTARQWSPLLYNMLYYIRNDEEYAVLALRSADGICQFISTAANTDEESENSAFKTMLSDVLLPALFSGVREPSEVIRQQYLKVMGHLIKSFPDWSEFSSMAGLLAGEDEVELSFFNNIVTLGKGKQSAALKQISLAAENGELSGKMVSHFFIPLIEHFIFDRAEGSDAHNLAAEATTAVGILAGSLEWPQYRAMLRRFIGYIDGKPELEKQIIRLLGKVIDALTLAAGESLASAQGMELRTDGVAMDKSLAQDEEPESPPRMAANRSLKPNERLMRRKRTLAATMPKQSKLADDLTSNILPPLTTYLHDKDESTVSLRVPVAVIVVRLLKLLPSDQLNERLPAVLTDVCHILRSKAQEARDMTRDTLVKICVLLGPSCFGFVLKELRGALARGSQLHVLSYTMHSILVATIPEYGPGDLDYCLPSIVAVIMDDIFGQTGQEKDAKESGEYTSKMKEIKNSKSQDSMELIAQTATLNRLTDLVKPIQALLKEKLTSKLVGKIDNLLDRISKGLLLNSSASKRDSLVFCFEVIRDVYASAKPQEKTRMDPKLKKYIIQKGAKRAGERGATTVYTYKLLRFAFDVMRQVLKKYDYLRTAQNLVNFVEILRKAVEEGEEEVQVAVFKVLTTIVKVQLNTASEEAPAGTDLYQAATAEAIKILRNTTKPSDISQQSLKLLTIVLRDRDDVPIKDTTIDAILSKMNLQREFEEPERREVTYKFLKSILTSRIETAIVYDTLDNVVIIMVKNSDEGIRKLARGAYVQFLLEYPQKGKRWRKQLELLEGWLGYEYQSGRLSVLDVINSLLRKASQEYVQKIADALFIPLVMVHANDKEEKCRDWAGELFKTIFAKADEELTNKFLTQMRTWVKQSANLGKVKISFQLFRFYYEVQSIDYADVQSLQQNISNILNRADDPEIQIDLIKSALELTQTLVEKFPEILFSSDSAALWKVITKCLSYPHQWSKKPAAELMRAYFENLACDGMEALPLKNAQGLKLSGDDINDIIRQCVHIFKTPELQRYVADAFVPLLAYLGICAGVNDLPFRKVDDSDDDDDEESPTEQRSTLQYLFARLSYFLRRESSPPRADVLIPKTAALSLLATLTSKLPAATLVSGLSTILLPLQHLTDKEIPVPWSTDELFKSNYADMQANASDILEKLQKKVGTQLFTKAALSVGKERRAKRVQRSTKRKIDAVAYPERSGKQKRKKVERKKERRKEKGAEHRAQRQEQ